MELLFGIGLLFVFTLCCYITATLCNIRWYWQWLLLLLNGALLLTGGQLLGTLHGYQEGRWMQDYRTRIASEVIAVLETASPVAAPELVREIICDSQRWYHQIPKDEFNQIAALKFFAGLLLIGSAGLLALGETHLRRGWVSVGLTLCGLTMIGMAAFSNGRDDGNYLAYQQLRHIHLTRLDDLVAQLELRRGQELETAQIFRDYYQTFHHVSPSASIEELFVLLQSPQKK